MYQGKPGVMKSRELTAEDIVYSYKRDIGWEKKDEHWAPAYQSLESITATDKHTVEFKTNKYLMEWWWWFGYATWGACTIYPEELVTAGIDDWRNHVGIGTGPFLLEDYVEGSHVAYAKNPNYWDSYVYNDKKYEIPFIDRMVKTLIQDKSSQIAALRTGKIDVYDVVEQKFIPTLEKSSPELKLIGRVAERSWRIGYRTDTKPFDDIRVRKALSMAIDREAFINTLWGGVKEIF